jgi:hypothetical protein
VGFDNKYQEALTIHRRFITHRYGCGQVQSAGGCAEERRLRVRRVPWGIGIRRPTHSSFYLQLGSTSWRYLGP